MERIRAHGQKLLAALLTLLAATEGLNPDFTTDLLGAEGTRWAVFLLASGTLAHSLFLAPKAHPHE